MKIRFCKNSPKGKSRLAKQLADQFPQLDVKVKSCCKRCKACRTTCFCLVDQQFFDADSWDNLYEIIEKML